MKKKIRNFVNNNTEFFNSTDILSARTLNRPLLQMFDTEEALSEYLSSTIKTLYHKKGNCIIPGYLEDFNNFKIGKINNKNYLRVPTGALLINEKPVFIKPNCEAFERALATAYGFNLHEYSNNINVNYEFENGELEYTVTVTYLNFDNYFTDTITGKDVFEVLENFDEKFNKFKLQDVYIDNNSLELLLEVEEGEIVNLYYSEENGFNMDSGVELCTIEGETVTSLLTELELNKIEFDNLYINDDNDKYHLTLDESGLDIDVKSCNVNIKSNTTCLKSNLDVTGATCLKSNLNVTGATCLKDNLNVACNATVTGTLTTTGATCLKSNLNVDRATCLKSNLNVACNATVTGTLTTTGATCLKDNLNVACNATVTGTLTTTGATYLKDNLNVDRATCLKDNLNVACNATVTGTLTTTGATCLKDNLNVACNATVTGTLTTTGATCLCDTLNVDRATCLNSTLDVGSSTTIGGTLTAAFETCLNSTLNVALATCLNSKLNVDGNATVGGMLTANGTTTLKRALNVTGATCLCDELYVCCKATLNNILTVDGATYLYDELDVTGATTLNDTLSVCCKATLKDELDVTGATTLNDTLSVCCKATLKDELGVCCNTFIDGTLYVDTIQSNSSGVINTCLKGNATTATCAICDGAGCTITTTYKKKQSCVKSPNAGTVTTTAFIDTISQDEQGIITATKKEIASATTNAKGIVKLSDAVNCNSTSLAATANAVKQVQDNLDDAIETEVSNRNTAISTAIKTEVSDRNTAISTAIKAEVSNRNTAISNCMSSCAALSLSSTASVGTSTKFAREDHVHPTTGLATVTCSNGYFGLGVSGVYTGYLRTPESGLIPYSSNTNGSGTIGTSSWPFISMHAKTFYGNLVGTANNSTCFNGCTYACAKKDIRNGLLSTAGNAASATTAANATGVTSYPTSDNKNFSLAFLTTCNTEGTGFHVRQSKCCSLTFNPSTGCTVICGSVSATSFTATSARDKKKDIVPTTHINAVEEINDIDIVDFTFKNDETNRRRVGFIADDTSPVFSGENQRGFDINNTVGMLLKAVQELSKEIKELKEKVK